MRMALLAAVFAVLSVASLGVALALRSAAQHANCVQIESLKKIVRPEPFDAAEARQLLADLNIDPDSEQAKRLLDRARRNNARERRQLAPDSC